MDDDNNQPQPSEQEPTNQPTNKPTRSKDQRSKIKQKEQEISNNKNEKEKNQKIPRFPPCFFCTDLWFCWNLSIKIVRLDIC